MKLFLKSLLYQESIRKRRGKQSIYNREQFGRKPNCFLKIRTCEFHPSNSGFQEEASYENIETSVLILVSGRVSHLGKYIRVRAFVNCGFIFYLRAEQVGRRILNVCF